MKTKLLWGVSLCFAFLLLLLITAPATLLTRTASKFVPDLAFSGVTGSFWQGNAQQLRLGDISLTDFQWQLSPWQLLLGRAALQFQFDDGLSQRGSGKVQASAGGQLSASEVSVQLPAQALQPFINLTGVQLHGDLQLELSDAALANGRIERLQGRLNWSRAQVKTPLGQPQLGAYAVDLKDDGEGGINGAITDIDGVLGLTGNFHLTMDRLELDASVRTGLPEELDRFFRVIGRPQGDRYALRWQQRIVH
ncbi:type II secretion system protein N [Permianibacter sp. IMCC34836]|uniref:type II secretion system protein N n=1 Tax=Permianibacter fluminis TaxID=2738515 RepID=UPI001552E2F9|nr:type II secretion system protein N [Permianibacter fluminis]NQD35672.1 type II secretion system protein N [Permianibacter fluminis]